MSDDDQNDDQSSNDPGRLRSMYEEAQARAAASDARAVELERREAFRDAGLDPSNPLHQVVMKSYDGPFEPAAVKDYVTTLGIAETPTPTPIPDPGVPESERTSIERMAEAARGDGTPPPTPDRRDQIREEFDRVARRGNKSELDNLFLEFSKAGGFMTTQDTPNADGSNIPTSRQIEQMTQGQ